MSSPRRAPHTRPAVTRGPLIIHRPDGSTEAVPNRQATAQAYQALDREAARIEHLAGRLPASDQVLDREAAFIDRMEARRRH